LDTTENQAVDLIGTVGSHVGAATAEIARLQRGVPKKTREVSVLTLRLKSALGDVTKLKKSKIHSQKTVAQFWRTSSPTTGTTTETGIQTETETAVGATDLYQLLDVELQLGLAAVYHAIGKRRSTVLATQGTLEQKQEGTCIRGTCVNWTGF
jgi:hypothetical protein